MRTMVRPSRFSSVPTFAARSDSDGSWPSSRRSVSRAASSSRRTRRTPRGQASRRSASIIAPRIRRSANVSNLMPRPSSKRWAASIKPITPSCTRSPTSIEWGIVDAMRRASASTKGRPATTRRLWAAGIEWARIRFRLLEGAGGFRRRALYRNRGTNLDTKRRRITVTRDAKRLNSTDSIC